MAKSHIPSFVMLLSTQDNHMKVPYGALSFQGPITFPGSVTEKEIPKAPAQPTALCYSHRMTQIGLRQFGF